MPHDLNRVRVEGLDWPNLLPATRLFGAFRMAIHPAKLALGLLLAVLLYLGGIGMDLAWGPQVYPTELRSYQTQSPEEHRQTMRLLRQSATDATERAGIFQTLLREELAAFDQLIRSALVPDFGFSAFLSGEEQSGVIGAILRMTMTIPGWLYHTHPGFLATYLLFAFLLLCLIGGAICRHAALHATVREPPTLAGACVFAARRYHHLLLTPLTPLLLMLGVGVLVALGGLLFNVPVLDVVGGLGFGLLLAGGAIIALLLVGLVAGFGLMFPAVAVEGADFFDAISRAYGYIIGRPWHWLFYNIVLTIYGAITYLFVGLIVFLTLAATKSFADLLVFREPVEGVSRLDAMLPAPQLGTLVPEASPHADRLNGSGKAAGWLIAVWVRLLILLLPAFAFSFYFSAQTWVYLLLRRSADGVDYREVYREPSPDAAAAETPDKIDADEQGHA
jgi:hypothetical protein